MTDFLFDIPSIAVVIATMGGVIAAVLARQARYDGPSGRVAHQRVPARVAPNRRLSSDW